MSNYKDHRKTRFALFTGIGQESLVLEQMRIEFGTVRKAAIGIPDTTRSLLREVAKASSTLYNNGVTITNSDNNLLAQEMQFTLSDYYDISANTTQVQTLALLSSILMVELSESGKIVTRLVPPHMAEVITRYESKEIIYLEEHVNTEDGIIKNIWDIRDPKKPKFFRTLKNKKIKLDNGKKVGWFWDSPEGPYIPAVLFQKSDYAVPLPKGAEPYQVEMSLRSNVYRTYLNHILKNASFPQTVITNMVVKGTSAKKKASEITGPKQLLASTPSDPTKPIVLIQQGIDKGEIKQLTAVTDFEKFYKTLSDIEADFISAEGISQSDVKIARSGYAIELSNQGKREVRRSYKSIFKAADLRLISVSAKLLGISSDGYQISYGLIDYSAEEMKVIREQLQWELNLGLTTKADVLAKIKNISLEEAEKLLDNMKQPSESID